MMLTRSVNARRVSMVRIQTVIGATLALCVLGSNPDPVQTERALDELHHASSPRVRCGDLVVSATAVSAAVPMHGGTPAVRVICPRPASRGEWRSAEDWAVSTASDTAFAEFRAQGDRR